MCSYDEKGENRGVGHSNQYVWILEEDWKQKRERVTCPVCKRRMWGWAHIHDGEIMRFVVPPHKKKKWWKKRKK